MRWRQYSNRTSDSLQAAHRARYASVYGISSVVIMMFITWPAGLAHFFRAINNFLHFRPSCVFVSKTPTCLFRSHRVSFHTLIDTQIPLITRFSYSALEVYSNMRYIKLHFTFLAAQRIWARYLLSECLSVCPSVYHTCESRLNGSRYRNTFNTVRQSDVSSLLRPNFV